MSASTSERPVVLDGVALKEGLDRLLRDLRSRSDGLSDREAARHLDRCSAPCALPGTIVR